MSLVVAWPDRKRRVDDDVLEERDVGLDAADAELAQRAVHALQAMSNSRPQAVSFTSSES